MYLDSCLKHKLKFEIFSIRFYYYLNSKQLLLLLSLFCLFPLFTFGQDKHFLRDSLDNKFDLGDWVLTSNGFIPIPYIITEPAVGGIGGALVPVFVKPNQPYIDTIQGQLVKTRVKPNIYAAGAAYTANGTWLTAAAAMGIIRKLRINYRIGSGYANINMTFYRENIQNEETSFDLNIKTIPVNAQLSKQIGRSNWSTGLNYLFLTTKVARTNTEYITPKEINSNVSRLGLLVEYDNRDNIFTPDKGLKWNTLIGVSDEFIGSDYGYTSIISAAYWYMPISKRIISSYRLEYQQIWGESPFYMKPFIYMRGIPIMRYQGNYTTLAETEWRWDFTNRHSLVSFAGVAKAVGEDKSFQESSWLGSGGVGWRYLLIRKLKLRAGIDIARGPEKWAYYIVFGTNWIR